jgi:ABC-type branched-subunit amino acid transport system permease subunit
LCQASFAAIGACATGQLATRHGFSVIPAMLVGALIAAAVGALIALPALRLGGIFLSLATLAFAFFFQNVLLNFSWVGGGLLPIEAPRPLIGSIDLGSGKNNGDNAYLVFALIVLVLVSIAVIWVRSGTTGRYLDAMRGSEVAAASIGINRNRARVVAFALSAAIAGLGGGLFASYEGAANVGAHYVPELGLAWIVLVVTLGSRTVEGAINAAVGFVFFQAVVLPTWLPWLVNHVQPVYHMSALPAGLQPILFGLGALTYAKHPEGILEFQKRRSLARVQRGIDRVKRGKAGAPPSGPSGSVDPKIAAAAGSSA